MSITKKDDAAAGKYMMTARTRIPDPWMLKKTNRNFMMIRGFRKRREEDTTELDKLIDGLPNPDLVKEPGIKSKNYKPFYEITAFPIWHTIGVIPCIMLRKQ